MTDNTKRPDSCSTPADLEPATSPKKTFVEPAISSPVDVLEAVTFFQVVDSGGTGLRKPKKPGGGWS